MISEQVKQLAEGLITSKDRAVFVEDHINNAIAFQLHTMREARSLTQEELGQLAHMAQERISTLENPDYGKFTLSTLKRLAEAFDVALIVKFAPFSELFEFLSSLSEDKLNVSSFSDDSALRDARSLEPIARLTFEDDGACNALQRRQTDPLPPTTKTS